MVFVPIIWKRTTPEKWIKQLMDEYAQHDPLHTVLAGFSLGGYISSIVAAELNPATLLLFSSSGAYAEDLNRMPPEFIRFLGTQRMKAMAGYSFEKIGPRIHCKTLLFVGKKELPVLRQRNYAAASTIPNAHLFDIEDMGHEISHPNLLSRLEEVL